MYAASKSFIIYLIFFNLLSVSFASAECEYHKKGTGPTIKAMKKIYVGKTRKYSYQSGRKLKNKKTNPDKPVCFVSNYSLKTGKILSSPVNIEEGVELELVAECVESDQTENGEMLVLMFKPVNSSKHDKGLVMNCFTHRKRSFASGSYYTGSPSMNQVKDVFKNVFDMTDF